MIEPQNESVRERRTLPASNRIMLRVNGVERDLDVAPWTTLLDALREQLDLTGTRKGCDHGNMVRELPITLDKLFRVSVSEIEVQMPAA